MPLACAGRKRNTCLAGVPFCIGRWARNDYNAAGNWLESQEPGPIRDAAIKTYAETVANLDPAAASVWAAEIGDPEQRQQTLSHTTARWHQKDGPTANTWLEKNAIDHKGVPVNR